LDQDGYAEVFDFAASVYLQTSNKNMKSRAHRIMVRMEKIAGQLCDSTERQRLGLSEATVR
jgi:hypothetical protein